jgi:hypothetical protein
MTVRSSLAAFSERAEYFPSYSFPLPFPNSALSKGVAVLLLTVSRSPESKTSPCPQSGLLKAVRGTA